MLTITTVEQFLIKIPNIWNQNPSEDLIRFIAKTELQNGSISVKIISVYWQELFQATVNWMDIWVDLEQQRNLKVYFVTNSMKDFIYLFSNYVALCNSKGLHLRVCEIEKKDLLSLGPSHVQNFLIRIEQDDYQ